MVLSPTREACGTDTKVGPKANSEVWLYRLGRERRLIHHAGCPEDNPSTFLTWATLGVGTLTYALHESGAPLPDSRSTLRRVDLRSGRARAAVIPAGHLNFIVSVADLGGGWVAYGIDGQRSGLNIERPAFSSAG